MPFYLTRDPVPSADMRNVFDNAQNLDLALNDITSSFWSDRLGRSRMSWFGLESAFTVKLSDFESRFSTQIVEQEATFDASQVDKENRFQAFLDSSGYVFLGDYEDGPFQFGARNQYIRYNDQYYRLNAATDVGFTTTGTTAASFANDVTHFVLMDGDTLRQNLGSGEPGMGASLSALEQGGTVQDALVCVYVDGFGADPSGETDSTDAVLRAVKTIATLLTSCYDNTNSKYAVVVFGNGTYIIGDVPFFSGIRYVGQGEYATRIQPKVGAQYCFTTVGTKNIDQAASSADRLFNSGVCRMSIGCGYQTANTPNYTEPPLGVGGIFVKNASYMKFEHLGIRFLDGCGIDAVELFDSDIRHVKMMSVGNARDLNNIVPAMRLGPDGDYSSTNAVRIHALHIEECAKHMHIGKRTRHVFFTGGCKLEGAPDTYSSTIDGVHNVTFDTPELTWQRSDIPMFEMAVGIEGINSSYGIVFENPSCISAPDTPGYYFHSASNIAIIQINNLFARDAYLIAEGSQIQVNGGSAFRCGPYLFNPRGDFVIDGFSADNIIVTEGLHAINLSGTGNVVRNGRFVSAGSETDETCVIAIGATAKDAVIEENSFGGTRGYAMILGNSAAEKLVYDNRQLAGAVFGTFIKNSQPRLSFTQAKGKAGLTDGTISISPGADGWVAIIGMGTVISLHCTGSDGSTQTAVLLTSYEINVVNLISQTGTMFKTDTTGAVIGNGFVYLTTALNSQQLRIINYSNLTLTIKLSGLAAALAF
ncbi:TPA: hypothetical protein ACGQTX_004731 [Raoultella ornithinolytica]|uniref:hypothetical protein n=1 Tax=Raoultella ornithinolytica TaxID=54291 RepID=UPI000A2EACEC|nr:Pectate lyase superfamily protein [Raoultella ornithinolytica]